LIIFLLYSKPFWSDPAGDDAKIADLGRNRIEEEYSIVNRKTFGAKAVSIVGLLPH
jgi:hypothetical protein